MRFQQRGKRSRRRQRSFAPTVDQRSLALTSAGASAASERCAALFGPAPAGGYSSDQYRTAFRALASDGHPLFAAVTNSINDWLDEVFA